LGLAKKRPIAADGSKAAERELIDDLVAVAWEGRRVVIVFDSDIADKYDVQLAAWEFSKVLAPLGAKVLLARLPAGVDGAKVGLDDFLLAHGAEALRFLVAAAEPVEEPSAPWTAPVPLGEEFDVPEFPRGVLAPWHEEWVDAVAEATQTPCDLAGLISMTTYGAGLARKVRVEVREGYSEPVNTFSAVALPPGDRKSAVFAEALQPVQEYEVVQQQAAAPMIASAASERRIIEGRLKLAEARAAKEGDSNERGTAEREAKQAAEELEKHNVPARPLLIIDDDTPESVARNLAQQGERLLQAAPEGTPIEIAKGRYSEKPNFDIYLKGHAGDPHKSGRIGREREDMLRPALSVALTVQPSVIEGLAEVASMATRGYVARYFYGLPRSRVGRRKVAAPPVPYDVRGKYKAAMTAAWSYAGPAADKPEYLVQFSVEADLELREFEEWLEPQLAPGAELSHLEGWAQKAAGAAARISGILHFADLFDNLERGLVRKVSVDVVRRAVRLVREYLIPHAKAAFGLMGADPKVEAARKVLAHLVRNPDVVEFTRTEIWKPLRGTFRDPAQLDTPLALLVTLNYLRPRTPSRPKGTPGPNPVRFRVNPLWDRALGNRCTNCTGSARDGASSASSASIPKGRAFEREPGEEG
jgi:hypothetical protein